MLNFKLLDSDGNHYTADLRCSEDSLKWYSNGCSHFLMVRTRYNVRANIKTIIDLLNSTYSVSGINELLDREIQIQDGVFINFFESPFITSFLVKFKPAMYCVYGCNYSHDEQTIMVYKSSEESNYFRNVSAKIQARIVFEAGQRKLFGKNTKSRYCISIPQIPNYKEGLFYSFKGSDLEYPVTEGMIGSVFYVNHENAGELEIHSKLADGYEVIND